MTSTTNSQTNIEFPERIVSLISGSLLMCSIFGKRGKFLKAMAGGYLLYRGSTGYCPAKEALFNILELSGREIDIKKSLTVNKPRNEVYEFWRKLDNLPLFMKHLQSVRILDEKTSEWIINIPGGFGTVSWKSEITEDVPYERISWQSLPESNIENEGMVFFRDAGKFGTEIHVHIAYRPPAGIAGEGLGKLLNPVFEEMVKEDIKNFRRYLETGEIPITNGHPGGNKKN